MKFSNKNNWQNSDRLLKSSCLELQDSLSAARPPICQYRTKLDHRQEPCSNESADGQEARDYHVAVSGSETRGVDPWATFK